MAEIIYPDGRREQIAPGALPEVAPQAGGAQAGAPPPDLPSMLRRGYGAVSGALGRAHEGTQKMLEAGGAVPPEIAGMVNPVPSNVPEAVIGGVTSAIPFMKMSGGPVKQMAKSVGLGGGVGALVGAGDAAARGEDLAPGAIQGAMAGGAGGALAGLGQAYTAWKTGDTRRVVQAIGSLKQEGTISPPVRGMLPTNPQALFSRETGQRLQEASSRVLQTELDDLQRRAPGTFVLTDISKPPPSPAAPDKLSRLQGVNWIDLPSGTHPVVDVTSGQAFVRSLREVGEDQLARQAEKGIISELTRRDPGLGARYQGMIGQYSNDQKMIGAITALRDAVELPGGGSPVDFPKVAEATRLLGLSNVSTSAEAHALMNALLAASHPTSFYGAGHAVGALQGLRGRGLVDPSKVGQAARRAIEIPATAAGVKIGEALAPGDRP